MSKDTSPVSIARRWFAAGIISAGIAVGGIYDQWYKFVYPTEIQERYRQTRIQIDDLRNTLGQDGTIAKGSDGGLLFGSSPDEIRHPSDSRVDELGNLKNKRDQLSREIDDEDRKNYGFLSRLAVLISPIVALISFSKAKRSA